MLKKKSKEIVPGDVIVLPKQSGRERRGNEDDVALVISNEYPAGSMPRPQANRYCEPRVVYLAHQRDDRWLQTQEATFLCLDVTKQYEVDTSLRIQWPSRFGKFLNHEQLVEKMEAEGYVRVA